MHICELEAGGCMRCARAVACGPVAYEYLGGELGGQWLFEWRFSCAELGTLYPSFHPAVADVSSGKPVCLRCLNHHLSCRESAPSVQ